jgi:hypothetical protein
MIIYNSIVDSQEVRAVLGIREIPRLRNRFNRQGDPSLSCLFCSTYAEEGKAEGLDKGVRKQNSPGVKSSR